MTKNWIVVISFFLSISGFGQTAKLTDNDYALKPYWIGMIEMEGVNFNETLKAYDIYWQHHDLPVEEGDRYNGKGEQTKTKHLKKELKEKQESARMAFHVKKFLHWKIKNEPFVKENGNIMTAAERLRFHQQHQ